MGRGSDAYCTRVDLIQALLLYAGSAVVSLGVLSATVLQSVLRGSSDKTLVRELSGIRW